MLSDPRVVPLGLQLGDLLLSLQQLLPAQVQLFGQHCKLLQGHKRALLVMLLLNEVMISVSLSHTQTNCKVDCINTLIHNVKLCFPSLPPWPRGAAGGSAQVSAYTWLYRWRESEKLAGHQMFPQLLSL